MSESIQGVVSKVSRKNGRGAILFESSDIWYGAFSASQIGSAESGDNVGLTFKVQDKGGRTYHNVVGSVSPADSVTEEQWRNRKSAPTQNEVDGNVTPMPNNSPSYKALKPVELDRNRCIIRQNALTNAVACLAAGIKAGKSVSEDDIIPLAKKFEHYTSGDEDKVLEEPLEAGSQDWHAAAEQLSAA